MKHIKMKYFFVKDKVDDGEVIIEHMPTEKMWIGMHTKPSQGLRFETDRSECQDVPVHWPDETLPGHSVCNGQPMTPQECVGSNARKPQSLAGKKADVRAKNANAPGGRRVRWKRSRPAAE
jgi:hypothetical protein